MSLVQILKKLSLLPKSDSKAPLIDPAVDAALNETSQAALELRRELRGRPAIDRMLTDLLGDRYIPPLGEV